MVKIVGDVLWSLAGSGLALLIVEQDLRLAFSVADRVMVMSEGTLVHESSVPEFRSDSVLAHALLGIG